MTKMHSRTVLFLVVLLLAAATHYSQSGDQNFPTPVSSSEINGQIRARDIGDPRLTRYFYVFDGGQGDIFINVVTKNFAGDIDIFTAETLRPMTKMVIYPDGSSTTETGRLIYLRKGERLLLRVEGRSPNDDPATFRVKFGGSFIAIAGAKEDDAPSIQNSDTESGTKVNSVGTIVQVPAKIKPVKTPLQIPPSVPVAKAETTSPDKPAADPARAISPGPPKPLVVVTESAPVSTVFNSKKKPEVEGDAPESKKSGSTRSTTMPKPPKAVKATPEPKVDPLASIRLIIQLKTGEVIERSMNEVQKFSVDKGILVVIGKDGKTSRYSILDVTKVTIQ